MRYNAELLIKVEFTCKNKKDLKIKMWDALNKPFQEAIFGNKGEELNFVTLRNEKGDVIKFSADNKQ